MKPKSRPMPSLVQVRPRLRNRRLNEQGLFFAGQREVEAAIAKESLRRGDDHHLENIAGGSEVDAGFHQSRAEPESLLVLAHCQAANFGQLLGVESQARRTPPPPRSARPQTRSRPGRGPLRRCGARAFPRRRRGRSTLRSSQCRPAGPVESSRRVPRKSCALRSQFVARCLLSAAQELDLAPNRTRILADRRRAASIGVRHAGASRKQ